MLGLLKPTDRDWVGAVEEDLDGLLSDHAHCELKAAQSALSLVGRYGGEHPEMVAPLLALAHEEADHFREVHDKMTARGARVGAPRADGYVVALRGAAKPDHPRVPALLDRLAIAALIEARSCERFRLLAGRGDGPGLRSADLRGLYRGLMASEAQHYRLFASLAERLFGERAARARLRTLAEREASIAESLPLGPTVHG